MYNTINQKIRQNLNLTLSGDKQIEFLNKSVNESRSIAVQNIEARGNYILGNALTRGLNGHSGSCLMVSDPVAAEEATVLEEVTKG